MYIIYRIRPHDRDECYVGSTGQSLRRRIGAHFRKLKSDRHSSENFQRMFDLYPDRDLWIVEVLAEVEHPTDSENYWIEHYAEKGFLLNAIRGANGGPSGLHPTFWEHMPPWKASAMRRRREKGPKKPKMTPEERSKFQSELMKRTMASRKAEYSERMKKFWLTPEAKAWGSERSKKAMTPERREKQAEIGREVASRPEVRAKINESLRRRAEEKRLSSKTP